MILTVTNSGIKHEMDTRLLNVAMSPIATIKIGNGTPNPNPKNATAMVATDDGLVVQNAPIIARLTDGSIRLYCVIPQDGIFTVKEVGVFLANGTLYAYGGYSPEFTKPEGLAFNLFVTLAFA